MKAVTVIPIFLLPILALLGCGGESSSSSSTKPSTPVVVSPPPVVPTPEMPKQPIPEQGVCFEPSSLAIVASDDGSNDGNVPSKAVDNNTADTSRWSSNGVDKALVLDLGSPISATSLSILWYQTAARTSYFSVDTSLDQLTWQPVLTSAQSNVIEKAFERYEFDATQARYLKIIGKGNSVNDWNSIIEVAVNYCGELSDLLPEIVEPPIVEIPTPEEGVTHAIELNDWYLSIPTDDDGSGTADSISESMLVAGYVNEKFYYPSSDGGLVFKVPVDGYKTSTNTNYTRTELREMLRRGNTSHKTQGVNKNNWVFSTASQAEQDAAGGVDGTLEATLAVNHVTTTGVNYQVGRVIIGQIHANDDEPIRLYYRKLPNNSKGSIYFAHEVLGGDDVYFELIGTRSDSASNPADGIALNEKFSYKIDVVGNLLTVTIMRDGKANVIKSYDMTASNYHLGGQYMYFKAGVYNQNNSGLATDYAQATFYKINNSHTGYNY